MKSLFVCLLVLSGTFAFSQDRESSITAIIADIYKSYTEEEEKELDFDTFMEELLQLSERPVRLNTATRSELSGLVFLSENQIENLLFYIYQSEGLVNLYELQLVEGFDMTDISRLLPFVTLGESNTKTDFPSLYEMLKFARSEVLSRVDLYPQLKKGFITNPEKQKTYQGENFYHYIKYQYDCKKQVMAGFTLEKDQGEQMFGKQSRVYDFMSAFIQVDNMGMIEKIVAGDFKATFGQGLVLKQGGSRTAGAGLSNLIQINQGFQKYSSVGESGFFRGVAGSLNLGKFRVHSFISFRKADGNYEDSILKSIHVSGYHRTVSEMEERKNLNNFSTGFSAIYAHKNCIVGVTGLYNQYQDSLLPDLKPYNLFKTRDRKEFFSGINYRLRTGKFNLFGEVATNKSGNTAWINGFTFIPASGITMGGLFRYYDCAYDNPFAAAYSKGSQVSNETGFFSGIEIETIRKVKISLQSDVYKFPWLKYGIDFPSLGEEYRLKIMYSPFRTSSVQLNFKIRKQEMADDNDFNLTQQPVNGTATSTRIQLQQIAGPCEFSSNFEFRTYAGNQFSSGTALWQNLSFYKAGFPLKVDLRWMIFDVPEYQNRIYAYENDLLYAFSIPAFYGRGSRWYALFRYSVTDKMDVYFKLAETIYADGRLTSGSGYDEIKGNRKTDVKILFRWKIPHF